jgi:hypothetical protein
MEVVKPTIVKYMSVYTYLGIALLDDQVTVPRRYDRRGGSESVRIVTFDRAEAFAPKVIRGTHVCSVEDKIYRLFQWSISYVKDPLRLHSYQVFRGRAVRLSQGLCSGRGGWRGTRPAYS